MKVLPSPYFQSFSQRLVETVHQQIADCIQKSYDQLEISDACKLLGFGNVEELSSFTNQVRNDDFRNFAFG